MSETFTSLTTLAKTAAMSHWYTLCSSILLGLALLLLFVEFGKRISAEARLRRIRAERHQLCVILLTQKMRAQKGLDVATTLSQQERFEAEKRVRKEARDFCRYKPPDVYLPLALQDWEEHAYDLNRKDAE
jgi:hypothetical protein